VRCLIALGASGTLLGFAAGHTGALIAELARDEGLPLEPLPASGEARVSTVVLGDDGSVTRLYEFGPEIGAADEQTLLEAAAAHRASGNEWALVCGAATPGAAAGLYAGLLHTLRAAGYRVMLDATGEQLAGALTERPDFVKVNLAEACSAVGEPETHCLDEQHAPADDLAAEALELSRRLVAAGARGAVVTAGAAGAAGLIDGAEWRVRTAPVTVVNPVGSGDCFAAALLLGFERNDPPAAALALAAGAAAANATTARNGEVDAALARELAGGAFVGPPGPH
jgi:fructose-1-phosphate kinase PfkB-like protein